jgi:glycosyltransferase involved in cell wall biosynthesis
MTHFRRLFYLVTSDAYFLSHRLPVALAAKEKGFDVFVVCSDTGHRTEIEQLGFKVLPLYTLKRTGKNPFNDLKTLTEIAKIYEKYKPDIVHHVALKPVLYGSIAAFLNQVPRTINALTGLGYVFISKNPFIRLLRFIIMGMFRFLFQRQGSTLIVQNQDDYEKFRTFLAPDQIALIKGSGVDTSLFCPPKTPPKNNPLKLALVSRMLWDKGIGETIEAIRLLKEEGVPITLLLCGDPDPENPKSIDKKTLELWHRGGLCTWMGHQHSIATLYQSVDGAILPSYREGLPKSLMEAASAGLPIITSDVPGCREVVRDHENGFLIPISPLSIASAIKRFIALSEKERQTMGQKSRALACRDFASPLIATQTLDLYRYTHG